MLIFPSPYVAAAGGGYTETGVTVSSAYLTASAPVTAAPGILMFGSIVVNSDSVRQIGFSFNGANDGIHFNHNTAATILPRLYLRSTPTANTSIVAAAAGGAQAVRIHLLATGKITGGNIDTLLYEWNATAGSWTSRGSASTVTSDSNIDLAVNNFRLFARADDAGHQFAGTSYRQAMWTFASVSNVPDISSSTVQNWFTDGSSTKNPATSQANMTGGTLLLDMYGAASRYNAGTNDGSLTLTKTGTFS